MWGRCGVELGIICGSMFGIDVTDPSMVRGYNHIGHLQAVRIGSMRHRCGVNVELSTVKCPPEAKVVKVSKICGHYRVVPLQNGIMS